MPTNYIEEIAKRDDRLLEIQQRGLEIKTKLADIKSKLETADEEGIKSLRSEAEGYGKEQASLAAETEKLTAEKAELVNKKDEEAKEAFRNAEGTVLTEGKEKNMENEEVEKRVADWKAGKAVQFTNAEVRSALLVTGDLAKPTAVGGINDHDVVNGVLNAVNVESHAGFGSYNVAYKKANATASKRVPGTAPAESEPVFGFVTLKPYYIGITSLVDKHISEETPLNYQAKIISCAMSALRSKAVDLIINGDGTDFCGIKTAVDKDGTAMYVNAKTGSAAIDANTLRSIFLAAVGEDDEIPGGCTLVLCRKDLQAFGAVRGSNEKKAVFDITMNPDNNSGIIQDGGTSVKFILNSKLAQGTMIYGKLDAFTLALFGNLTVSVSAEENFSKGMLTVLGEANIGGNICYQNAIAVVTVGTAA